MFAHDTHVETSGDNINVIIDLNQYLLKSSENGI